MTKPLGDADIHKNVASCSPPAMAPIGLAANQRSLRQRHSHDILGGAHAGQTKIRSAWCFARGQRASTVVPNHPRQTTIPIMRAALPETHITRFRALALLRRGPAS